MKRIILLLIPLVLSVNTLFAQDGNDQVTYTNLALQFSDMNVNGDPSAGFIPSVASSNGFGGYLDNPASVALMEDSYFTVGLLNNRTEQQNIYLGNSATMDDDITRLGNMGFVYKLPTAQGSFVFGGGYNIHTSQNRINQISGRNNQSTITDQFKDPGSDYFDLAYNTYAIDWGDEDSTYQESIFRIGFDEFPGITQDSRTTYSTQMGEYSFFFGTEFQENLYVGISGGISAGTYTYRRDFLEMDAMNDYNTDFIEGSDVDNILVHDEIDADILGFNLRAGLIYKINENFNVGASYLLPSNLTISETYYSSIQTTLDDGLEPFFSDIASNDDFTYKISRPGKLNIGLAAENVGNFSLSTSAEIINHSNLELDLVSSTNFDNYEEERDVREQQNILNDDIADNYKTVVNVRAGLKYQVNEFLELRGGYAFLPGRSSIYNADKSIFSGGFGLNLTDYIQLDFSAQYAEWDDESVAYSYYNNNDEFVKETISENVNRLNLLAGIKILF